MAAANAAMLDAGITAEASPAVPVAARINHGLALPSTNAPTSNPNACGALWGNHETTSFMPNG
jgi:hypothetical protein